MASQGTERVSSQQLSERLDLSAAQIRKDLAQLGELGIRGVGYDIAGLVERLTKVLRLDQGYRMVVVGMGNLGRALSAYFGFNHGAFVVVAGVDPDPEKFGLDVGGFTVRPLEDLAQIVRDEGVDLGVLAVPASAAQESYDRLVAAGVRGVLNFAPAQVQAVPQAPLKSVDLRIYLEELVFSLPEDAEPDSSSISTE